MSIFKNQLKSNQTQITPVKAWGSIPRVKHVLEFCQLQINVESNIRQSP